MTVVRNLFEEFSAMNVIDASSGGGSMKEEKWQNV